MEKLKTNYKNNEKLYADDVNLSNGTINEIEDVLVQKQDKFRTVELTVQSLSPFIMDFSPLDSETDPGMVVAKVGMITGGTFVPFAEYFVNVELAPVGNVTLNIQNMFIPFDLLGAPQVITRFKQASSSEWQINNRIKIAEKGNTYEYNHYELAVFDVDGILISCGKTVDDFAKLVKLTQAEYDELVEYGQTDDRTLYVITDTNNEPT